MPNSSTSSDIIIIGGGVIGLMAAWRLAQAGLSVTLFESGRPGAEASAAALGILLPAVSTEINMGPTYTRLCQASVVRYPEVAAHLRQQTNIDVELHTQGVLQVALNDHELETLEIDQQLNDQVGVSAEWLNKEQVRQFEPHLGDHIKGALRFKDGMQVDNIHLCTALTLAAAQSGVTIRQGQPVTSLTTEQARVTGVTAGAQTYQADWVVVAAGSWSGAIPGLSLPVRPAKGQAIAIETPFAIRHPLKSSVGFIAPRRDGRLLIGATVEEAGFDKRTTVEGVQNLLARAIQVLPELKQATVQQIWAGLRPRSIDDLPILGPVSTKPGLLVATGHFRNGIMLAPITADLILTWVTGQTPELEVAPFSPDRFLS